MEHSQLNTLYLEHFQFRFDPFDDRKGKFQFFQAKRRTVLEQLVYFARYGRFVLAVTGPEAAGKTVLRHALVAAVKDNVQRLVVSGSQTRDAATFLQHMAKELGCAQSDSMSVLAAIEQLSTQGRSLYLIVDDAELVSEAVILLTQRIAQSGATAKASVFLFGKPSLQTLLQDVAQKAELEHHVIELESWSAVEVQSYLQMRLEAAGASIDVFTDAELEQIISDSKGWPGRVNEMAKETLLARVFDQPVRRKKSNPLSYKYVAALLVIAFLFVLVMYQQEDDEPVVISLPPAPAIERVSVSTSHATERTLPKKDERIPLELPVEPALPQAPLEVPVTEPVHAEPIPPVVEELPQTVPPPAETKPAAVEAVKPKATQPAPDRAQTGYGWFVQQPANHYTLQLFASSNEQAARSYVQKHGQLYQYFRKQHDGKFLYVVTYGSFPSHEAASAEIKRLPADLGGKPWARTFASIVKEIQ